MLNEQFWNMGELNECRDKISEFIKNFPICRNFDDVQKKQLEDGIYDLIYSVKEPVFRAAEREYFREDVTMKIKEFYDEKGETILNSLPVSELDVVVDEWQDDLSDCDVYGAVGTIFGRCFYRRTFAVAFFGMPLRRCGSVLSSRTNRCGDYQ